MEGINRGKREKFVRFSKEMLKNIYPIKCTNFYDIVKRTHDTCTLRRISKKVSFLFLIHTASLKKLKSKTT